jgi:hypothetical protein
MARKYYTEDNEAIPAICFEESQPVGFTLITDQAQLHDLIKGQYLQRSDDGANYYNDFRTDRYMDILNGVYTDAEVFALESHLENLGIQIATGNWITAQNTNSNLSLSGIYNQVMKDEIQTEIDVYISLNY